MWGNFPKLINNSLTNRLKYKIKSLNEAIEQQVEAATDPANFLIKENILEAISKKKLDVVELENKLDDSVAVAESDKEEFLRFAFNFIENMGNKFLDIPQENREKCKQIVFPAGLYINANKKVYTPELSPLYTLATNKKDLSLTEKSLLVPSR